MSEPKFCEKHPKIKMEIGECHRCGGQGFTDDDIEKLDNPIEWHDGDCYQCRGTGRGWPECWLCEEEAQYAYEMEQEAEAARD